MYRARDTKVGRTVALKLTPRRLRDPRHRQQRLLEDARPRQRCRIPNIATLFDVGDTKAEMYLGYEFAAGDHRCASS